ncbi:hypothetical protein EDB95_4231 [Dinghuibacter silviterrae]|uniref:Tetratricopeptide repeat protein n=2 Tax=Dinghuibacter silviterrae TaxID=1539049 RepID=A0A4V3GKN8_9BACT|nr:hypothetical protein EDB95_4231 [Dinghuibacter silviterrae]
MFIALALLTVGSAGAQSLSGSLGDAYTKLMSARDEGALMQAGNRFSLIAAHWGQEWAANYYAAYAKAFISQKVDEAAKKDALLDEADKFVAQMNALHPNSDEGQVLTAYVAYARMMVNPSSRWKTCLPVFNASLAKAKQVNPSNPRIYYLEGVPLFHKPKVWGGGPDKAKPDFEKAKELFARQDTTSILKPYWGEQDNNDYLSKCN